MQLILSSLLLAIVMCFLWLIISLHSKVNKLINNVEKLTEQNDENHNFAVENYNCIDSKVDIISDVTTRSFLDLSSSLEHIKTRIEDTSFSKRPQAEKWNSLKEAFSNPVKSVELNERSGTF